MATASMTDDQAAAILFVSGLRAAVEKGDGAQLSPWETECVLAVEKVTGETFLEGETIQSAAAKAVARHANRGPAGTFIPAGESHHRTEAGSILRWSHGGARLVG